ncbi:5'-3' exoribonuclease 1 isoform X2 [Lutzomyia longipalpis]|uniref:5'-3' exoribonuclease 1 isoform X2 n=1 Tax=Lutzomyia longipalpis TaxID=7200 RepID=UPI0024839907|nr:5'-3' exoribonuclease 1 isoform X2 [Lutzomyia longipalpis]
MGVPKFFRYISERYPGINELVRENEIPEFDNLYLDMNGIIHTCSHPDDSNVHYRISEEQIFKSIFHYLDVLFRIIKPQKLMFMAVDGVAPRAKMNQQRGRRFRTAKETERLEAQARAKGEKLPDEPKFDSNCITPGTPFMARLQKALKFFVKQRISQNDAWKNCRVILSGHETPGEGEHKIMEYIRYLKSKPDWDPNTRHCLYGLDADLIMLGLCTHEQHFSLLREEVKFGKHAKHAASVDHTRFYLLHLGLLREYIEMEFECLKETLPFAFDIESIVDDWVFMGFLVGNDFIPNLPNLHINKNALPEIYAAYKSVLPTLDGYLNDSGQLKLERLELFLKKLGQKDREFFEEHYDDLKYLETKRGLNGLEESDTDTSDMIGLEGGCLELEELARRTQEMCCGSSDSDEDNEEAIFEKSFTLYKRNYYITKLKYPDVTEDVLREQTKCYIEALQWTLFYYYRGIISWGWYYPHHYAPFVSDLQNFRELTFNFEMGRPFLPFEQLLAVLPAASKAHLPEAYQGLMTDPKSHIIDYYPTEFETDLNGKRQEWEAVVLIPFINEERLLQAMAPCHKNLTDEEVERNAHGPMLQYDHVLENQGVCQGPGEEMIHSVFAKETPVDRIEIYVPHDRMVLKMSEKTLKGVHFPGFPTTKHLQYTSRLETARVKVFEQPSLNPSMIIHLDPQSNDLDGDIRTVARNLVGKEVFIGWPHLVEARVTAISNEMSRYGPNGMVEEQNSKVFNLAVSGLREHNKTRLGINIGETTKLVHVQTIESREYIFGNKGVMTLSKNWTKIEQAYPLQTIVKDLTVHNPDFMQFKTVEEVFPIGSTIFLLSTPQYGCRGEVIDTSTVARNERIRVSLNVYPEPEFPELIEKHRRSSEKYLSCLKAATEIGITPSALGSISGSVIIIGGQRRPIHNDDNVKKTNVGLLMQSRKANTEIPGYTKKIQGYWYYSPGVVKIVSDYLNKFPRLFSLLADRRQGEIFEEDLQPTELNGSLLQEMVAFVKEQPHYNMERQQIGSQFIEKDILEEIIDVVQETKNNRVYKQLKLQIKPRLVYRPGLVKSTKGPDPDVKFRVFDRVIMASTAYPVPMGLKGTVVSIIPSVDPNPIRYVTSKVDAAKLIDVLFDEEFEAGQSLYGLAEKRVMRLPDYVLINITYGRMRYTQKEQKPAKEPQQSREFYPRNPLKSQTVHSEAAPAARKSKLPENQSPNPIPVASKVRNDAKMPEKPKVEAKTYNDIWAQLKEQKYPLPPVHMVPIEPRPKIQVAVDGSDLLRKLLKLDPNPADETTAPKGIPDQPTAPAKLPPPPPSWREEAAAKNSGKTQTFPKWIPPPEVKKSSEGKKSSEVKKSSELKKQADAKKLSEVQRQMEVNKPKVEKIGVPNMEAWRHQQTPPRPTIIHPSPKGSFQPTLSAFAMHQKKPPLIYPPPPFPGMFPAWQMRPNFPQQPLNFWPHARPQGFPMMPNQLQNQLQSMIIPPNMNPTTTTTGGTHNGFIPLQAARKIVKQKNSQQPAKETPFEQRNTQQRQRVQQNQQENRQKFTAFVAKIANESGETAKEESPATPAKVQVLPTKVNPHQKHPMSQDLKKSSSSSFHVQKSQPPTPRQARIAAKFDVSS